MKKSLPISIQFTLLFIAIVYYVVSNNINFGKTFYRNLVESDARGYYAYLPAVFIYHDLNFTFSEKMEKEPYFPDSQYYNYRIFNNGKSGNKYYCGTALAISPFYIGAHYFTKLTKKFPLNGYSKYYILSVTIAACFYVVMGLYLLALLLLYYVKENWIIIITILATAFGTQLFYYAITEPGMSHVYSFCFVNLFMLMIKNYLTNHHPKYIVIAAISLAMIVLIRPFNILILLVIPFLATNYNELKNTFIYLLKDKITIISTILLFLLIIAIQPIIYYIQMGIFWVDSYKGESFYFTKPHLINILFSYKKGLFLYTPLFLLSQATLYLFWKQNKWKFYTYLSFFFILTYILSSWWIWYYGGSFSLRAYIEYFGIFALLLALLLQHYNKGIKRNIVVTSIIMVTMLCIIQTYQYRYNIIHWSEMNQQKYWEVFLKIKK